MSEENESPDTDVAEAPVAEAPPPVVEIPTGPFISVGRRKTASARLRLFAGNGEITVNGKGLEDYFNGQQNLIKVVMTPLTTVNATDRVSITARVNGGGPNGQAGALSHAVARALQKANPENRIPLKRAGLLTRDHRGKERKKPGQPGARKRFQFSKR